MPLNYNVFAQSEPTAVFDPVADDMRSQQVQAGQFKLRDLQEQRQREQSLRPALAEYAGGNRARLADIMAIDPERGMQLQGAETQQMAAAEAEKRARATDLVRILDGTKTFDELTARRRIAARLGYTDDELDDLPDSPDQFDPNYFAQLSNVLNNTSIKDGRSVTQERGTINYGTDEDIRQEADRQRFLDERERFTQAAQDRRSAASNSVTMRGQNMTDARARETAGVSGTGKPPKVTEAERTAGFLANRLAGALTDISAASAKSPNAAAPGIGEGFASLFGEQATNRAVSADRQQIRAAQLDALDAALTLGTGAAYTSAQLEGYRQSYFPALGDKPSTVAGKKARFLRLLESAAIKAGAATPPALVAAIEQGRSETTPKVPTRSAPNKTPPAAAVAALRNGQGTPEQFDAIFGAGSAARYRKGR